MNRAVSRPHALKPIEGIGYAHGIAGRAAVAGIAASSDLRWPNWCISEQNCSVLLLRCAYAPKKFPEFSGFVKESKMMEFPKIIQGGMGVGVSNWRLAQAVSKLGQLGVVSGTALDQVFVRRLADGDLGGDMRRGLDAFPFPDMARRIWQEYFVPGGKAPDAPYPITPMHQRRDLRKVVELCIVSNFVEVFLAREGHKNPVGINFLEKVQMPHLSSIYGAMLAGVGYVLMGAGIPLHIPGVLDAFAAQHPSEYKLSVTGAAQGQDTQMQFDPADYAEGPLPILHRPRFLAIVSSNTLATTMLRRASGQIGRKSTRLNS